MPEEILKLPTSFSSLKTSFRKIKFEISMTARLQLIINPFPHAKIMEIIQNRIHQFIYGDNPQFTINESSNNHSMQIDPLNIVGNASVVGRGALCHKENNFLFTSKHVSIMNSLHTLILHSLKFTKAKSEACYVRGIL